MNWMQTMRAFAVSAVILIASDASSVAAQDKPVPAAFAACKMCHKVAAGQPNGIGPNLWQIGGRRAGSAQFNYSAAMKASTIIWNKATLTAFTMDPRKTVPDNRMPYAGLKDPQAAAEIAAYLMAAK
jgi:cytochrome c